MTFTPQLAILPPAQRVLWPWLAGLAPGGYVLYGGTAIALRYGHRVSVDFDFFTAQPLDQTGLNLALPWLRTATVLQEQPQTLTVITTGEPEGATGVKLSWFGGLTMGRIGDPEPSSDGVALVASPLDLLATKLKVMLQRAERKDYLDIAMLLRTGLPLARGLAAARALYGPSFPISEALKALVYFHDGDLAALPQSVREQLEQEVRGVDELPWLERTSLALAPKP